MNSIAINKIYPKKLTKIGVKSLVNRVLFGISILDLVLVAGIYFAISTPQVKASLIKNPTYVVSTGSSINAFIKQLPAGAVIIPSEIKRENLSVSGRMIVMNGDNLEVFEYPDSNTAEKEALQMSQKYQSTQNSLEWKESIHLYLKDNLLIFYMGKNDSIISALNQGISQRVAGGGNVNIGYLSSVSKFGNYYK